MLSYSKYNYSLSHRITKLVQFLSLNSNELELSTFSIFNVLLFLLLEFLTIPGINLNPEIGNEIIISHFKGMDI